MGTPSRPRKVEEPKDAHDRQSAMTRRLVVSAVLGLALTGCTNDASDRSAAATTSQSMPSLGTESTRPPSWFAQRSPLPSCGEDEEYEEGYPNFAARTCFRRAYDVHQPAELTRLSFGDEGESVRAHFRILGDGPYEVVAQHFASPAGEEFGTDGWERYDCGWSVFNDIPGGEVSGAPWLNYGGECVVVASVPG